MSNVVELDALSEHDDKLRKFKTFMLCKNNGFIKKEFIFCGKPNNMFFVDEIRTLSDEDLVALSFDIETVNVDLVRPPDKFKKVHDTIVTLAAVVSKGTEVTRVILWRWCTMGEK